MGKIIYTNINEINSKIKNMTYSCCVGNYISDSWNNIICAYAKNDNNIPVNWLNDLRRINNILENSILEKMLEDKHSYGLYEKCKDDKDKLLGVIYHNFLYMPINKDNTYYIETICKNNKLNTAEDIEMKEYKWKDIELSLRVLDDFKEYGFNIDLAQKYYNLKGKDKNLLIKILDSKTIRYSKNNKPYINNVKLYKVIYECINKNELELAVSVKDSFNKLHFLPNYIKKDSKDYIADISFITSNVYDKISHFYGENGKQIFFDNIKFNTFLEQFSPYYFENPITKERTYLPITKDINTNKFITFNELNEIIKENFYIKRYSKDFKHYECVHNLEDIIDIDINDYIDLKGYSYYKDKEKIDYELDK